MQKEMLHIQIRYEHILISKIIVTQPKAIQETP